MLQAVLKASAPLGPEPLMQPARQPAQLHFHLSGLESSVSCSQTPVQPFTLRLDSRDLLSNVTSAAPAMAPPGIELVPSYP